MSSPIDVFISYAHDDDKLRAELGKHLSTLRREGAISDWHDRLIAAGQDWRGAIDVHLDAARIVLVLVSADFLASDYAYDVEMKRALERHERGEALLIPIIVRPCDWVHSPLGKLQVLPKDGNPVVLWGNHDLAWSDVVKGIRAAIANIRLSETLLPASGQAGLPVTKTPISLRMPEVRVLLDRYVQWGDVEEGAKLPGHQLFLLHGSEDQALEAFTQRVRDYLVGNEVVVVSTDSDGRDLPITEAMWEERLVKALSPEARGHASQLLHEAAKELPLFLVFGREPLNPRLMLPMQLQSLESFLRGRLAQIIREAAPNESLRIYIAIEEAEQGPSHIRFDAALKDLANSVDGTYWGRRAVTFPEWTDVHRFAREYLRERLKINVPRDWMDRLENCYNHHKGSGQSYDRLCKEIEQLLRQLPGGAS